MTHDVNPDAGGYLTKQDQQDLLYLGFYQGLAWTQGLSQGPLRTVIPDEMFGTDLRPFDLVRFFQIVEDADSEGQIHFWEIHLDGTEAATELTLHCSEDAEPDELLDEDIALSAYQWLDIYIATQPSPKLTDYTVQQYELIRRAALAFIELEMLGVAPADAYRTITPMLDEDIEEF